MLSGMLQKAKLAFYPLYLVEILPLGNREFFEVYPDWDEDVGRIIYILPLIQEIKDIRACDEEVVPKQSARQVYGLLLAPTNDKKGEFYRTGYLHIRDADPFPRFEKALEVSGARTAELVCAEVLLEPKYPTEKYIITII